MKASLDGRFHLGTLQSVPLEKVVTNCSLKVTHATQLSRHLSLQFQDGSQCGQRPLVVSVLCQGQACLWEMGLWESGLHLTSHLEKVPSERCGMGGRGECITLKEVKWEGWLRLRAEFDRGIQESTGWNIQALTSFLSILGSNPPKRWPKHFTSPAEITDKLI